MTIDVKLIDQLLTNYKKPEDIIGENGLLKELTKAILERTLAVEMSEHLGYEKHDPAGHHLGNTRNGKSRKTLRGDFGELELATPRDHQATFEPKIVAKHQTRWTGFHRRQSYNPFRAGRLRRPCASKQISGAAKICFKSGCFMCSVTAHAVHVGEIRQVQHDSFGVRNQLADLEAEKIVHTRHQLAGASDNGGVAGTIKPSVRQLAAVSSDIRSYLIETYRTVRNRYRAIVTYRGRE